MTLPQGRVPGALGTTQTSNTLGAAAIVSGAGIASVAASTPAATDFSGCGTGLAANASIVSQLQHDLMTISSRVVRTPWQVARAVLAPPTIIGQHLWDIFRAYQSYRSDLHQYAETDYPSKVHEVFGSSIDFSTVWISTRTGAQNRPFTATASISTSLHGPLLRATVMHLGSSVKIDTLIHELAHVWQAQHHSNPEQYMLTCLSNQATAEKMNVEAGMKAPSVRGNAGYPQDYPHSAYAYKTDTSIPFTNYGGEQIAQMVERGVKRIVDVVKFAPKNSVNADNVASLANLLATADRSASGVAI
jgi:hypothetical protein